VDKYIFLLKLVGRFGAKSDVESRLRLVLNSLEQTLRGRLIALHATMGEYDFVAIADIPADQDKRLFDCLVGLRGPGDVEVTILRAFDYLEIYPGAPPKR
jgi:uncharacterized protein with GYD domain